MLLSSSWMSSHGVISGFGDCEIARVEEFALLKNVKLKHGAS